MYSCTHDDDAIHTFKEDMMLTLVLSFVHSLFFPLAPSSLFVLPPLAPAPPPLSSPLIPLPSSPNAGDWPAPPKPVLPADYLLAVDQPESQRMCQLRQQECIQGEPPLTQ